MLLTLDDFDYPLPRELIAEHPSEPREAARLMLIPAAEVFADHHIADLPDLLQSGDLLVCNDTKVIPARLVGRRGAARVELTLHRDEGGGAWRAFAKGARRLRHGDRLEFAPDFAATVAAKHDEGDVTLRFTVEGEAFRGALANYGTMPLPPYIKRPSGGDPRDRRDYQTMFASADGAVAAPTAGLHFTPALVERLAARDIGLARLTLHVGPGTFCRSRRTTRGGTRCMPEWGTVSAETAARIAAVRRSGGRIVAIGTTSLRALGVLLQTKRAGCALSSARRRLFVLPGYRFRAIDLLSDQFPPAALDLADAGRGARRA